MTLHCHEVHQEIGAQAAGSLEVPCRPAIAAQAAHPVHAPGYVDDVCCSLPIFTVMKAHDCVLCSFSHSPSSLILFLAHIMIDAIASCVAELATYSTTGYFADTLVLEQPCTT